MCPKKLTLIFLPLQGDLYILTSPCWCILPLQPRSSFHCSSGHICSYIRHCRLYWCFFLLPVGRNKLGKKFVINSVLQFPSSFLCWMKFHFLLDLLVTKCRLSSFNVTTLIIRWYFICCWIQLSQSHLSFNVSDMVFGRLYCFPFLSCIIPVSWVHHASELYLQWYLSDYEKILILLSLPETSSVWMLACFRFIRRLGLYSIIQIDFVLFRIWPNRLIL